MTQVLEPSTADLRSKLVEQASKLRELRETPPDKQGETHERDAREAILAINSLDAEFRVAETYEAGLREWQEAVDRAKGPTAATANVDGARAGTLGERVAESDDYRNWVDSGKNYRDFRFEGLGEIRTLLTTGVGANEAGVLMPAGQPIAPMPRQMRLAIRDLLASGNTNLHSFPYVREVSPATNETAATAVAEGAAKPEVVMQFASITAIARKIAAWIPATDEILADAPTLRSYIDARLVYMVKVREDLDLLFGDEAAASPEIPGILSGGASVTGVQTQTIQQSDSVDDLIKTLGLAVSKVELVDGFADGMVLNPADYWQAITTRWGDGGGHFDSGSPFVGPPGTIWGLPVVRTRAMTADRGLVGDFRNGGQIFDREGVTVRSSDSHDDYFVKNKVAILAEERLAVAWYRPDFFVDTDLAT